MKNFDGFGIGLHAVLDANYFRASGVDTRPRARRYAREYGNAVSRTFFSRDGLDFVSVDVSLNLSPQSRVRAAAAESNSFTRHF